MNFFRGLAIYDKEYDWKSYPVIRLDMSELNKATPELVNQAITEKLRLIGLNFGIDLESLTLVHDPGFYLSTLLKTLNDQGHQSVVLIDEYDYPILKNLGKGADSASKFLEVLREFYIALKINSNYIHFTFITGVTQLAHTTIFSGVNNFSDISYLPEYADLLGYTQEELESNFKDEIELGAISNSLSKEEFLQKVNDWYDGYRFSDQDQTVYNPSDINLFFKNNSKFNTYWISTGSPTFILEILSKFPGFNIQEEIQKPKSNFFTNNILNLDSQINVRTLVFLLYQSGYLTIKNIDDKDRYYLGFPNREVKNSFTTYLASAVLKEEKNFFDDYTYIVDPLIEGKPRDFA